MTLREWEISTLAQLDGRDVEELVSRSGRNPAIRRELSDKLRALALLAGGTIEEGEAGLSSHGLEAFSSIPRDASMDTLPQEPIRIPAHARGYPIATVPMKRRTRNVLMEGRGYRVMGDLDGLTMRELLKTPNFGRTSELDLLKVIANIDCLSNPELSPSGGEGESGLIRIPSWAADWPIEDLPLGKRVEEGVSGKLGVKTLSDLERFAFKDVTRLRNFGKGAARELSDLLDRIQAGEFGQCLKSEGFPEVKNWKDAVRHVKECVEKSLEEEPEDKRAMLQERIGLDGGDRKTLEATGKRFNCTRERVRQVVDKELRPKLRRCDGPRLLDALENIRKHWESECLPLDSDEGTSRLLRYLEPSIPGLGKVPGFEVGVTVDPDAIREAIAELLEGYGFMPVDAAEACRYVKRHVEGVTTAAFYNFFDSEKGSGSQFKAPGGYRIAKNAGKGWLLSRSSLKLSEVAMASLEESPRPMSGKEILQWAGEMGILGQEKSFSDRSFAALANQEGTEGFFLFGSGRIGLRKHIQLPMKLWGLVRNDFEAALKKRPDKTLSVIEFHRESSAAWKAMTNANDLDAVVRLDDVLPRRFEHVSRMTYRLASN